MIIAIAFPSRGVCDPAFAVALRLLEIPFFSEDDRYSVVYSAGADTAVARNLLAEKTKDVADYIFFLDDDTLPPINTITKLLSHEKHIIAGLYFAKQEPHFPQIFLRNEEDPTRYDCIENYKKDSLIEVDTCGAGCLLVKTEVFKNLKKPYFKYEPSGEGIPRKGEDFYFCEKAKEAGYKIFCDTSIICKHIGTKYIGPEHWEISRERLIELKKKMGEKKFKEWRKLTYN